MELFEHLLSFHNLQEYNILSVSEGSMSNCQYFGNSGVKLGGLPSLYFNGHLCIWFNSLPRFILNGMTPQAFHILYLCTILFRVAFSDLIVG
jgi:hypothetical protein